MTYSEQERRTSSVYLYMDPSAFVKRYHDEKGTELVNELFKKLETREERFTTSVWSIAESVAVLNRIKNKVKMKEDDFAKILMAFFSEIKQFHKEPPLDTPQLAGGRKAEIRRRQICLLFVRAT